MPCSNAMASAVVDAGAESGPHSHQRVVVQCRKPSASTRYASAQQLLWASARMPIACLVRGRGRAGGAPVRGRAAPGGRRLGQGLPAHGAARVELAAREPAQQHLGPRLRDAVRVLRCVDIPPSLSSLTRADHAADQPGRAAPGSAVLRHAHRVSYERVMRCAMKVNINPSPFPRLARKPSVGA